MMRRHQGLGLALVLLAASGCAARPAPTALGETAHPSVGDLSVQVILVDHVLEQVRWSPDGRRFALGVGTGTAGAGRVDVYTTDGAKDASFPGSLDAAWLDPDTLVTFDPDPYEGGGTLTIHSLTTGSSEALPGPGGGILGNNHGLVAISVFTPPDAAPDQPPTVRILGHWDAAIPPGGAGYWSEGDPIAGLGWPMAWSADGTLLAFLTPVGTARGEGPAGSTTRLAAATVRPASLAIRRFPGNAPVPLPDVTVDSAFDPTFSPDGRWLTGLGGDILIDLQSGTVHTLPSSPAGWTPDGDLVLRGSDQVSVLWQPGGSTTGTGLPPGLPVYGPLPGEVALLSAAEGDVGAAMVTIASRSVSVPPLPHGSWTVSWSPDGSACLLETGTDDAQLAHDSLIRLAPP
jgi:hypothetical protein